MLARMAYLWDGLSKRTLSLFLGILVATVIKSLAALLFFFNIWTDEECLCSFGTSLELNS